MKQYIIFILSFISLTAFSQLKINELMSNNVSAVWDDAYNYSMWVELFNDGNSSINQENFFLTDKIQEPRKWKLPKKSIPSKGFNIVWMENPDRPNHSPFKLDPDGDTLYLLSGSGVIIDQIKYPEQFRNVSYGRLVDGSQEWVFFEEYSPGNSNNGKATGTVRCKKPVLSVEGGLYNSSLTTGFETPEEGDTVFYNLNSEEPTRETSQHYIPGSVIAINSNTVIRAKTFSSGKLSSNITSATYLIGQREFNLPVVSLITPPAYLFDNTIGIYVEGTNGITGCGDLLKHNWNQDWDRPANFELFDRNKVTQINQEIDIKTAGCFSRATTRQKSLHLQPKKKIGKNTYDYAIFNSRPTKKYKDITIRNSGNDAKYSMMRDAMSQTLIIGRMDLEYLAYEPSVLFVNGEYYGIQNLRQRSNADLLYTSYGLDKEDVIMTDTYDIINNPYYQEMMDYITDNDIKLDEVYDSLMTMMDVENYMHYNMTHIYTANYDWPHNNIKLWKKKENGKWRWILYDTDFGFNLFIDDLHAFNSLTYALGENPEKETKEWATELFSLLIQNDRFRNEFIDRFSIHLSSTFETTRVNRFIDSLANQIKNEIVFHKQRWDTNRVFETDILRMKNFSANRPAYMLGFLSNRFLDGAAVQTIAINSNIPNASFTFNDIPVADNTIELKSFSNRNFKLEANKAKGYNFNHWELVGVSQTHHIIPWNSMWMYWDGSSIPDANWKNTNYTDTHWKSGQSQLGYGGKGEKTTIDFGSDSNNKHITAYFRNNINLQDIALISSASIRLLVDDGAAVYVNGTEVKRYNLPDGELNFSTKALNPVNGDYVDITVPVSLLKNGNNTIAAEVHQVNGFSSDLIFNLEFTIQSSEDESEEITTSIIEGVVSSNMQLRAVYEKDTSINPESSIYINEIVASNTTFKDEFGETDDLVELYNAGSEPVNISGWYISDKKDNPKLWKIPQDPKAVVPANGFLVLWADEQIEQGALHLDFKLSASGEHISIHTENQEGELLLIDAFDFPALSVNQSYSRVPDGGWDWKIQAATPLESNVLTSQEDVALTKIKVYPANFSERLIVENANESLLIMYDLTGKKVFSTLSTSDHHVIYTGHLPSGIYILKTGHMNFKLIK